MQQSGGALPSSTTPERLPSFLLSGTPMAGTSGTAPQSTSPSAGAGMFRSAASPPTAITFNERLRAGGGATPRRGGSGAPPTPGRMPPARSLLDGGAPAILPARASPTTPARAVPRGAEKWVTVFGFPSSLEATVVREFRRHGDIVRTLAGKGNWVHLMFTSPVNAQVALHKHWRTVAQGSVMVGIVPCTEPELARDAEDQLERGILSASPSLARGSTPMLTTPSPAHRALRTPTSILRRDSTPATSTTPSALIRTPQPQRGIFGYLADLYG